MAEYLDADLHNLLLWSGVGGIIVPTLCYSLRRFWDRAGRNGSDSSDRERRRTLPADQLQGIEGVGPQIAGLLAGAGLTRFEDVAAKTPDELQDILTKAGPSFELADPATWPEQARLIAAGDIEGFLKLAIKLTAGVTVLENITGIGAALSERLRLGGINTVAKLARSSVDKVEEMLTASGTVPAAGDIAAWIDEARNFSAGNRRALSELAGNLQRASLPAAAAAALAGPANTPAPGHDPGMSADPTRWPTGNAALICSATIGALLILLSIPVPSREALKIVEKVKRFERDCSLSGTTTFPASALFFKGSSELKPDGEAIIQKYVGDRKVEASQRQDLPDTIVVFGYASEEGSIIYNQQLSDRRARTIAERLRLESGWPSGLFRAYGKGKSGAQSCATNPDPEACRASDRKVEVLVVYGKVSPRSGKIDCGGWRDVTPVAASR
ncbi:helix-hairpin-helix domain-containing protein [Sphingomonas bacterium]|uniref:helix-hairpin-helix domain-containing protein n=1 Tax=Sphingomonas bacterium TaxID=1895847 RepID=UPI00260489DF|nr:helix-hairpin-helix domain-containing protein [Sphingomonas bacterium]MDB5678850.1 hypothetical protein [Sphingomonas bacterium]